MNNDTLQIILEFMDGYHKIPLMRVNKFFYGKILPLLNKEQIFGNNVKYNSILANRKTYFMRAIELGNLNVARLLYEKVRRIKISGEDSIYCASKHINIAKWLYSINKLNICSNNNEIYYTASYNNNLEMVKWLFTFKKINDGRIYRAFWEHFNINAIKWLCSVFTEPNITEHRIIFINMIRGNYNNNKFEALNLFLEKYKTNIINIELHTIYENCWCKCNNIREIPTLLLLKENNLIALQGYNKILNTLLYSNNNMQIIDAFFKNHCDSLAIFNETMYKIILYDKIDAYHWIQNKMGSKIIFTGNTLQYYFEAALRGQSMKIIKILVTMAQNDFFEINEYEFSKICVSNLEMAKFLCFFKNFAFSNILFECLCCADDLESVKILMPHVKPETVKNNKLFMDICEKGALDIAKYLHSVDSALLTEHSNYVMCVLCSIGDLEFCKWLYEIGYSLDSSCIINACSKNHLHILKWIYEIKPDLFRKNIKEIRTYGTCHIRRWLKEQNNL